MSAANPWAKIVMVERPYKVFTSSSPIPTHPGNWEWRVLKAYQTPEKEKLNPYARWFCAVRSPYTGGEWEYGDEYIRDIPGAIPGMRE